MEENLEKTFSADPYRQMGGYVKRCRGANVYFKMENPPGARIQQFFAEGAPLEDDHLYTVSFVTEQGVPPHYDRNRTDTGPRVAGPVLRSRQLVLSRGRKQCHAP